MTFTFDAPAGASSDGSVDLLQGARALQAAIHDESHQLPPISRSLAQIEQETRALAESAARTPAASAETFRFLAAQGIDADCLDPAAFDLALDCAYGAGTASAGVAGAGAAEEWDGDVDGFLAREHLRVLIEAVGHAGDHVGREYERAYWGDFVASWQKTKPQLLEQLCAIPGAPAAPPAVATSLPASAKGAAAPLRSRTRSARHLAYGSVFADLLSLRRGSSSVAGVLGAASTPGGPTSGGVGFRLLPRMAEAASAGGEAHPNTHFLSLRLGLTLLIHISKETKP